MKKVLKIFLSVLVITVIIVPFATSVSADEIRVYDDAGLFTSSEKIELESQIKELKEKYNHDFVIVTTNDTNGKSIESYADYYYDYNGFGVGNDKSGCMFTIDMGNRKFDIIKNGLTNEYVTNKELDKAVSEVESFLKDGQYYRAAQIYLEDMSKYIDNGKYNLTPIEILIAVLISLVVGGIIVGVIVYKYSFAGKQNPYPLKENSKLNLTKRQDVFLNKTVTHVRIQSPKSGSSGGSRGGRSHGGGSF